MLSRSLTWRPCPFTECTWNRVDNAIRRFGLKEATDFVRVWKTSTE